MNAIFSAISTIISAFTNLIVTSTGTAEKAVNGIDNVVEAMVSHTEVLKDQSSYECKKSKLELDDKLAQLQAEIDSRTKA
tara:strand:+ start:313 stop:552 length:240 start_codon:yes stop_codon:yes gene_type:complete